MTDLATALDELRTSIAWPDPAIDVTARAIAELRAGREVVAPRRPWLRPLAVAVVATVLVGGPAVAGRLGGGRARITFGGDTPAELGTRLTLGPAIELAELGDAPLPVGIGAPVAAYAGDPSGAITVVWAPDDELPEVLDTGIGLLLTWFPGRLTHEVIEKRGFTDATIEVTVVDGGRGWWVSAPHAFAYVDESGRVREDTLRLSGNALLWERDGVTYRLESSLSRVAAVRLAESMP